MSNWTGKSRGNSIGYKIFIGLIKLDVRLAYLLLKPVSLFFLFFSNKSSITYFYSKRLGYGKVKTYLSIHKNYIYLGKVLIDKIAILSGQKNQYTFNFDGEEHLHQMVEDKKGGLLLGAHMGNWEVAGELLERVDSVINILMMEGEHQKLKEVMADAIGAKKVNIIPIKDDMSHVFSVIEAFKNKEIVAMHGDRYLEGNQNLSFDFLGAQASFPIGPMMLAGKYKIPVSFVFSVKETNRHYHFFATKGKVYPIDRNPVLRNESLKVMLNDYVAHLEEKVLSYPLQWFNYHKFWNNEKQ